LIWSTYNRQVRGAAVEVVGTPIGTQLLMLIVS
jgi:hypothetical protein